jgi:murein DD-endopeptidase MepM/ murein hydrolase activator NlpD
MAAPKINFGDFTGLKEKGVSPKTLETLKNAVALGARVTKRADLIKVGIPADEADLIATNSSLSTDPPAKPVSVTLTVTPTDLVGYALGVQREVTGSSDPDETLVPIVSPGKVAYGYDDAVTGALFTLFVKSPGGDFVESTLDGTKATHHTVKKAELGKHPLSVVPVPEVPNAKSVPAVAEPLLPPARLKGRLISGNPKVGVEKRQIVIEVALKDSPADTDFFPVCYAETESNGYFFTSQLVFQKPDDFKNLTAARARVALESPIVIPIRLDPVTRAKGKLPGRLILYFEAPTPSNGEAGHDEECTCGDCTDLNFHDKKVLDEFSYFTVVRTTEPLIETYEIDDVDEIELDDLLDHVDPDVRGTLTGLKVNRAVLVNFISRNQTITKANAPELVRSIQADVVRRKVLALPTVRKGRVQLNSRNEIDWDEKPTVYQAISIAHGHLLHFKQEWFHDGYSIGDLLYSLPLAPGQKKQIVVFDWDRKESAANVQQLDYQESLYNSLSRDRDVNEVARATLNENIRGSSEASSWGVGGGLGIGAIIPIEVPIGALLGVGGGFGKGSSSASQDASRTTTASSQQQISDRTVQAANSVRSQRSTVIQTVSQGERFQVSAESVANYNHCHAMTIQYFEVLRHFEARTRLADVQECLFVPLKMSPFTPKKALRWRDLLFRCLRKRFLAPGFDALYRIEEERESATENYYDKIGLPRDRFAEEELEYIEGELYVEFQVQRPRNDPADEFLEANWALWAPLLGDPREFYNRFLRAEQRRDDAFARHAGPRIAEAVFDEIRFHGVKNGPGIVSRRLPVDATLLSDFRNRAKLNISLRMSGPMIPIKREDIDYVKISLDGASARSDILRSLTNDQSVRIIVHAGSMRYRTRNLHEHLFQSTNIKNDLTLDGDDVRVFCPLSAKALRRPRQEDVDVSNDLLHHLNENLEYYHQCIWSRMDPQRRFMLLDGVVAPGRSQGRSVASVVENKLIGIVGNCLVMPVAPGFKLDPVLDETVDLFEHYYEDPRDPMHISLPTKGVFAEAVMGQCNSCEFKEEERFWRWEESPIPDNPTAINAITAPVPQVTQPNLTPKDFPQPIISLQNAPTLPDPQGFGALTSLLANPNLFRDITGLTENQKNALAALQASLKTAEQFGQGAQALTGQAAELFKFNKLTEMLGKGQITKDEFKELVNKGQEAPELGKLKGIKEAVDKKQVSPETGERLNDATLKKIEKDADKGSDSVTERPAVQGAIDSFNSADEGSLALEEGGAKLSITKGTGGGPTGTPTVLLDQPIADLTDLNNAGVELSERITENGDDIFYEVFAKRVKVSTGIDIEDAFVIIDMTLDVVDRATGAVVTAKGAPVQLTLKARANVAPNATGVSVGKKQLSKAVPKNQNLRRNTMGVSFIKGNPNASITPAGTLFLFPFPLSVDGSNEFTCDQPPADGTGTDSNTTHVSAQPQNKFAVDFTMPSGTEVFAMRDGVVVFVVESNPDLPVDATTGKSKPPPTDADFDKANLVRVRHDDGTFAEYVHLKKDGADVAVGDAVTAGTTKIGSSGNSGFSSGPHLHVAIMKINFDETASTTSLVSIPFKFKGPTGAGVTPGKGQKFKRT